MTPANAGTGTYVTRWATSSRMPSRNALAKMLDSGVTAPASAFTPERVNDPTLRTYDPVRASPLTFEDIDHAAFPLFGLGCEAGRRGGAAPAAYNAANEVAVRAFLDQRIGFNDMADIVMAAVDRVGPSGIRDVADVLEADGQARSVAREAIQRMPGARTGRTG